MEHKSKEARNYSRRRFLKGIPLGFAGVFVASTIVGRFLSSSAKRRRQLTEFPEDSIFSPAKDRYPKI